MNFPIIPCDLCGSQKNLEREKIKSMLNNWEKDSPGRINNIFGALSNIELSQLAIRVYLILNLSKYQVILKKI